MANIQPTTPATFDNVYQIETTDVVLGGAGQNANRQAESLVNRTQYLKNRKENEFSPKVITSNASLPMNDLSNYSVQGSGIALQLNDYTIDGFEVKITVDNNTDITYKKSGGTLQTDTINAGLTVKLKWTGTYWEYVRTYRVVSADTTLTLKENMDVSVDTDWVCVSFDNGAFLGQKCSIICNASACYIRLNTVDATDKCLGIITSQCVDFIWNGTYWIPNTNTVFMVSADIVSHKPSYVSKVNSWETWYNSPISLTFTYAYNDVGDIYHLPQSNCTITTNWYGTAQATAICVFSYVNSAQLNYQTYTYTRRYSGAVGWSNFWTVCDNKYLGGGVSSPTDVNIDSTHPTSYTVPADNGEFVVHLAKNNVSYQVYLYINDVAVINAYWNYAYSEGGVITDTWRFPVKKGDVIKIETNLPSPDFVYLRYYMSYYRN